MIGLLVVLGCIVVVAAAAWAAAHMKHPENIDTWDHDHKAGSATSDDLYAGADRPAGPDAEDATTAVPNRFDEQPPGGAARG